MYIGKKIYYFLLIFQKEKENFFQKLVVLKEGVHIEYVGL
jgi:hypothetical protein